MLGGFSRADHRARDVHSLRKTADPPGVVIVFRSLTGRLKPGVFSGSTPVAGESSFPAR